MRFLVYILLFFFIPVFSFAQPLVADAGAALTICEGEKVVLGGDPTASGGDGSYRYRWTPADKLPIDTVSNPETFQLTDTVMFYLTVTDSSGNSASDSVFVSVDKSPACYQLVFYNTFTPNGDEINDTWIIEKAEKYPENTLEIFNRYGKVVFRASPYNNDWNGKGLTDDLPVATYYYVFDPGAGREIQKGSVTIIR